MLSQLHTVAGLYSSDGSHGGCMFQDDSLIHSHLDHWEHSHCPRSEASIKAFRQSGSKAAELGNFDGCHVVARSNVR